MTAGISPRALSLRTAERPTLVRDSTLSLTCFPIFFVLDVEQRRSRLVVVNSFDALSDKLGHAEHRDLKSVHGAHRGAVASNYFRTFRFLQPSTGDTT